MNEDGKFWAAFWLITTVLIITGIICITIHQVGLRKHETLRVQAIASMVTAGADPYASAVAVNSITTVEIMAILIKEVRHAPDGTNQD